MNGNVRMSRFSENTKLMMSAHYGYLQIEEIDIGTTEFHRNFNRRVNYIYECEEVIKLICGTMP